MYKVLAVALVLLLCGCWNVPDHIVEGPEGSENISVYIVEGKTLECLHLLKRLSCNWGKYNLIK